MLSGANLLNEDTDTVYSVFSAQVASKVWMSRKQRTLAEHVQVAVVILGGDNDGNGVELSWDVVPFPDETHGKSTAEFGCITTGNSGMIELFQTLLASHYQAP